MNYWRIINRFIYFFLLQMVLLSLAHGIITVTALKDDPLYYLFIVFGSASSFFIFCFTRKSRVRDKKTTKDRFERINTIFNSIQKHYNFQEKLLENMFTMVDSIQGMAMWIKDENDRYLFADKTLRELLLNDLPMKQIIGKTDSEIKAGDVCEYKDLEELIEKLNIEDFPSIPASKFEGKKVCNITDVITRISKRSCRFYEEIDDYSFDVWKTPVVSNEEVQGTVGCLVNVTDKKELWRKSLKRAKYKGLAYQIDSSPHYILRDYGFSSDVLVESFEEMVEDQNKEQAYLYNQLITIMNVSKDGIIMMDAKGYVSFWNPMAEKIFGYSENEILGYDLHEFIAPKRLREKFIGAFEKFKVSGEGCIMHRTVETIGLRKDRTEIPVEVSLSPVYTLEGWAVVGIVRDITERKEYEEYIKKKIQEFEILFRNTPFVLWSANISVEDNYKWYDLYNSPYINTILGYDPHSRLIDAATYFSHVMPEYIPEIQETIKKAVENPGQHFTCKYKMTKLDGAVINVKSSGFVEYKDGQVVISGSTVEMNDF